MIVCDKCNDGQVTDAMVERAARAWEDGFDDYPADMQQDALNDARRALTSALRQEDGR